MKKRKNKRLSCPHKEDTKYIYDDVNGVDFELCEECHKKLLSTMLTQQQLEKDMDKYQGMGYWERACDELGIKVLRIKKRNWLVRMFSINYYRVKFEFKGSTIEINAWANIHNEDKDKIYWCICNFLTSTIEKSKFKQFLEKYK